MAKKFGEYIQVKLPDGAKEDLAKIAAQRYQSVCSVARQAIMEVIDRTKQSEGRRAA
jgi:predicted transcriptional regulator